MQSALSIFNHKLFKSFNFACVQLIHLKFKFIQLRPLHQLPIKYIFFNLEYIFQ